MAHQAGSKNYLEKIAIVGAGGNSGSYMVDALLKTGKHVVTAITRTDSKTVLPKGVQVKKIDYENQSSLVEALQGQDALVITMGAMAPKDQQIKLIEAAAEAGVQWLLPNEWGGDTADEEFSKEIMIGNEKKVVREKIRSLGKSSWIAVSTGFWYEWSVAISVAYGFDIQNRTVTLYDEGETLICTSTWPQVGRTVASLLSLKIHPEGKDDTSPCLDQFKDKYIYVSSFTVSQKDMLDSILRVTQTSIDDWKVTKEPVHERYAAGIQQMKSGDRMGFGKALYARGFYPDGKANVEKTRGLSNDLLGLPKEDLDEYTKIAVQRAIEKNGTW